MMIQESKGVMDYIVCSLLLTVLFFLRYPTDFLTPPPTHTPPPPPQFIVDFLELYF